jgi:hypothetical protein
MVGGGRRGLLLPSLGERREVLRSFHADSGEAAAGVESLPGAGRAEGSHSCGRAVAALLWRRCCGLPRRPLANHRPRTLSEHRIVHLVVHLLHSFNTAPGHSQTATFPSSLLPPPSSPHAPTTLRLVPACLPPPWPAPDLIWPLSRLTSKLHCSSTLPSPTKSLKPLCRCCSAASGTCRYEGPISSGLATCPNISPR